MKCITDQDCEFLFHCAQEQCEHNSVFPLSIYTVFIYLLIPIGSGLVNSTGHSMGLFKVLIVMNALRYQSIQATMITQAMIVGTALPNFFSILMRKHPTMPTSLVNFNLVFILVPCCLLGSTLGSFITLIVPNLVQEVMTFLVFSYFSWTFYQKYRKLRRKEEMYQKASIVSNEENISTYQEEKQQRNTSNEQSPQPALQQRLITSPQSHNKQITNNPYEINPSLIQQRDQILAYQKTIHLKDIMYSLGVFVVFEFIVFLVQGRLPILKFTHCDWKYWMGIVLLVCMTFGYLTIIRIYLKRKFHLYELLQIHQQIMLNQRKQFNFIMLSGLLAGMVQGILGVGSGSCMMSFLLTTSINTQSASATTGYQVLFIGMAALIQGFINGEVNVVDTGFFMVVCVVLGGVVTLAFAYYLQRKDQVRVSKIVVLIAAFLCIVSVVMVVPNVITLINESGWSKMMEMKFSCQK